MIWLQSNERYDAIAEYDHSAGSFTQISRRLMGSKAPLSTDGIYSNLSSAFVAIYQLDKQLFLRIDDNCIPMTNDVVVSVGGDIDNRWLVVLKAGIEVFHVDYGLDSSKKIPGDPTAFIEKEDFDFGLFLSNVSKSQKRKRVLLGLE